MANENLNYDVSVIIGAVIVFLLPLTILIPNFSIWDVIPKVKVIRFHIMSQQLTWPQINAAVIAILCLFFCLYLEIRRRRFEDMVDKVLTGNLMTEATLKKERERQKAAIKVCVRLLDSSTEHYESLALLQDELRQREKPRSQLPPAIESSLLNF